MKPSFTAGVITACILAITIVLIGAALPLRQKVTYDTTYVTHRKVVQDIEKRVHVVNIPPRTYPPLKDWKEACTGAPVIIRKLDYTPAKHDENGNETSGDQTWIIVQPAGDDYQVTCVRSGAYIDATDGSPFWYVGMLTRINAKLDGA